MYQLAAAELNSDSFPEGRGEQVAQQATLESGLSLSHAHCRNRHHSAGKGNNNQPLTASIWPQTHDTLYLLFLCGLDYERRWWW